VYGRDLDEDMAAIRDEVGLGVCPQHDVLFPDLTVAEHLRLFAGLKGVPSKDVPAAVQDAIATVGLTEKV
jgi:ATP-binding cassette subfamily A (ABC1) protein 3